MDQEKRLALITKARELGIMIAVPATDKPTLNMPISETKDVVVGFGKGVSAIMNKNYNIFELGKAGLDAAVGFDQVDDELADMDEDEFIEVFAAFELSFNIDDPENVNAKYLEQLVEGSFFAQFLQTKVVFDYLRNISHN